MGAARACLETAIDYAKTRVPFGKPIAGFQLTQREAREHGRRAGTRAGLLALHLGRLKDEGRLTRSR